MTDYVAYVYPTTELYRQELSTSLSDGLDRWDGYSLFDVSEFLPKFAIVDARVVPTWEVRNNEAYVFPEWGSNLFGHILIIPSVLNLGNVATDQTRSLEIMNLFLEPRYWETLRTDVDGLIFLNAPAGVDDSPPSSYSIPSFGSYTLQIGISSEGPVNVSGDIDFEFDVVDITVPVTGTRVVVFHYQPRVEIEEKLSWKTDVLEAHDGTEQRLGLRRAPRQSFSMQVVLDHSKDERIRGLLFDWLPNVFAVPIWWETRRTTAVVNPGDDEIQVSTLYGDFRAGGLVMLHIDNDRYEVIGIDSYDATSIQLNSEVTGSYPVGTKLMPLRNTYSTSVPTLSRVPKDMTEYNLEFVVIDNVPLADATGQSLYDDKIYLDDCNLIVAGEDDQYSRPVTVLDNETGQVFQTSRTDRSRFGTKKCWDVASLQELWRIRRLLHSIDGSRKSFFIPTFRNDLTLTDPIGADSTIVRVRDTGYGSFVGSRRPFSDIRLTKRNGFDQTRRVLSSVLDGNEEVLTLDDSFDPLNVILPEDVLKIEFVTLVRISDDTAMFYHRHLGDAMAMINLITVKE